MEILLYDYGCPEKYLPKRAHANDVGADVYALCDVTIPPESSVMVPLGFGVAVPAGYAGFIFVRSSMAKANVNVALPPIDPGYTGEVHACITNNNEVPVFYAAGSRIGQLVFMPVATPSFTYTLDTSRGAGAFGSTGA